MGTAAIQLAREEGVTVITTAGSPEKIERCLDLGAALGINYQTEDFAARTLELTGGRGVDVILDWIGAPYLSKHIEILKPLGRLVIIGLMGWRQDGNFPGTTTLETLAPHGIDAAHPIPGGKGLPDQGLHRTGPTASRVRKACGRLLTGSYPIEAVEEAHQYMKDNRHFGKIVLRWE